MSENFTEAIMPEHTQYLDEYAAFSAEVDGLLQEFAIEGLDKRREHPAFIGSGLVSDVFLIRGENKNFVAKIPRSYDETTRGLTNLNPNPEVIRDILTTGIRSKGIPHLEQIRAVSYEKGVVISELIPGKTVSTLTAEEREKITDEQLKTLVETFRLAREAGVVPELENPDNMLYDPVEGFGIIDLDSVDNNKFRKFGFVALGEQFDIDCVSRAVCCNVTDNVQQRILSSRVTAAFSASDTR